MNDYVKVLTVSRDQAESRAIENKKTGEEIHSEKEDLLQKYRELKDRNSELEKVITGMSSKYEQQLQICSDTYYLMAMVNSYMPLR